jgi:sugar fermentation stimulation protein A
MNKVMHGVRSLTPPVFFGYDAALRCGILQDRRDRFIATVKFEESGDVVDAHCINTGRMEAFVDVGARVWLLPAASKTRKLKWSWEAIEQSHALNGEQKKIMCGVNTIRPNALVRAALEARCLQGLGAWTGLKAEAKFEVEAEDGEPHSGRADFLLDGRHFIEVKNCHLVYRDGFGYFPDSVSERASRHMDALAALVRQGHDADVIFVVQRDDVLHGVRPSAFHDPAFACAARRAADAGVRFRAIRASVGLEGTWLTHELPVDLSDEMSSPQTMAAVEMEWEANRPTTGWTRSQSGSRVANGPFAHHTAATKRARQQARQPPRQPPRQPRARTGKEKARPDEHEANQPDTRAFNTTAGTSKMEELLEQGTPAGTITTTDMDILRKKRRTNERTND